MADCVHFTDFLLVAAFLCTHSLTRTGFFTGRKKESMFKVSRHMCVCVFGEGWCSGDWLLQLEGGAYRRCVVIPSLASMRESGLLLALHYVH